jgi:hypothetical protein
MSFSVTKLIPRLDILWCGVSVSSCPHHSLKALLLDSSLLLNRMSVFTFHIPTRRSAGSGMVFTLPREDNRGATWKKQLRLRSRKPRLSAAVALGIPCAGQVTAL